MSHPGDEVIAASEEKLLPPLITPRSKLWRGPLILTGISRILMVPWYLFCAVSATSASREFLMARRRYFPRHILDQLMLTGSLWWFFLFSILLVWLFFAQHRIFRPLMGYFSLMLLVLVAGLIIYMRRYPSPPSRTETPPIIAVIAISMIIFVLSGTIWPFYYFFSPRMKRVFTR